MYVRRLQINDLEAALKLAWEVFEVDVAPTYSQEGIEEFKEFIKYERMLPKVQSREISFFEAREGNELCGISAIREDGHICLLFVRKEWQRHGAARSLFHAMQQYCVIERNVRRMSVSATLNSVEVYKHLGFAQAEAEQMENGIRFVPMIYMIKDAKAISGVMAVTKKRRRMKFLWILVLAGLVVFNFISAKNMVEQFYKVEEKISESSEESEKGDTQKESSESEGEDVLQGMEAIECYQSEELSYEIKEEKYEYYSSKKSGEYPIEFDVNYPQIEGLDSEIEEKVNQMLEECAMTTVKVLYLEPSEDTKEAMIKLQNPVLLSGVTYKVTYATDEFISVVFEDHYYAGNSQIGYADLRTRNINLKDGTVYEVKDVVDLSDDFMTEWKTRMQEENPNSVVFNNLRLSELRRILNGEILDENYFDTLFVDKNGVQIGITYHYTEEDVIENGWTTAPFTMKEMEKYQLDSEFWSLVD